mgnify:CR=1 FL=1
MKKSGFDLLSVEEMRRKYGLVAENRPTIRLSAENVPKELRHLIPLAELWGVSDDLIRDDMVKTAPRIAIDDLKRTIEEHDDLLDDWLAGPEAQGPKYSAEYTAFSAMRMAADFA